MGQSSSFGKKTRKGPRKGPKGYNTKGYALVTIRKSRKKGKKLEAVFESKRTGRRKTVPFGASGMSDYTKHKNPERKKRYLTRHRKRENWNDPVTPGALSRWILWNKPSLQASITDYKRRFKF